VRGRSGRPWPRVLPALVLVVLTAAVHAPGMDSGWVWDDDIIVTGNVYLRDAAGLAHIWFELETIHMYSPAVLTTLWIEYQLWGLHPLGYHLVNLGFHVACVLLLWGVLRRLEVRGAWLAAALFGVHPVMVESVAWVSEIKNVQSAFFCLLTLLAFLRFRPLDGTEPPGGRRRALYYLLTLLLFALALLSKAVAVTVPPALLVLVWWKRGRVEKGDVLAVVPMMAMGLASAGLAMYIERHSAQATGAAFELSLLERVLVAGRAVWFYAGKLLWPANLVSIYPRWQVSAGVWWQYLFPLGAASAIGALWYGRGRFGRGPLAAVLCFGLLVSPLVGIFNVAYHLYSYVADHFQYHAAPALLALFASGVARLRSRSGPVPGRAVDVACGGLLLVLGALTTRHVRTFHDEKSRCLATIEGNPGAWSAMYNLGLRLKAEGDLRGAVRWYTEALRVAPGNAEALNNMGVAFLDLGDAREAVRCYREALRYSPGYPLAHNNLATALARLGETESAIRGYSEALRLKPDYAEARANLAKLLAAEGRLDEAVREYREALRLRPDDADTRADLGVALAGAGRFEEAVAELESALRASPADAGIRRRLGTVLANGGKPHEAIRQHEEALRLEPNDAENHAGLARTLALAGQPEEAAREFEAALRLDPKLAAAHNDFGTLLASQGRVEEAIARYEEAVRLTPGFLEARANLGTALASAGRLREAVAEFREAVRLAPGSAEYREQLGVVLVRAGRLDEAIAEFERALELSPGSASARTRLDLARDLRRGRPAPR